MNASRNKKLNLGPNHQDMKVLEKLYATSQFNSLENKVKQLINKYPENINLQNILGYALRGQWKSNEAIKIFEKIIKKRPDYYFAYNNMGNVLKDLCRLDEAQVYYQKCIEINSKHINAYIGLGQTLLDLNRLDESANVFKQALKVEPNNGQLHRHLSQVIKYEQKNSHLREMEKIISNSNVTNDQEMHLSFALGKAYEDMESYEKAFTYWKKGNFLKKKEIQYSIERQTKLVQVIKKNFTKDLFDKLKNFGNSDEKLIFIIGMPRSGTTLVQQILSSHPEVLGIGESNQFSNKIEQLFFEKKGFLKKSLNDYDSVSFDEIRDNYIKTIRQFSSTFAVSSNVRHILVKDLLNFVWLGFIKIIFPKSKVIHCVRNSLDNCISLFKNYFVGGVDFSYDLIDLGKYYNLYKDVMLFWDKMLPNYYVNIFYEELISDPKKQIEKLLSACNLEWNEDCMQFYNNTHFMSTGSNSINIHQPIYKTSMQSWKRYEKQLQPLLEVLKT